jgi:hypothetical protein
MTYHILGDVNRHMPASIVDGNGMPDHLREDGAVTAPGANHFLLAPFIHELDFLQ